MGRAIHHIGRVGEIAVGMILRDAEPCSRDGFTLVVVLALFFPEREVMILHRRIKGHLPTGAPGPWDRRGTWRAAGAYWRDAILAHTVFLDM